MTKFKGSVNGQEVTININFTTNTLTNGPEVQNKVHISNLEIDDIQLIPLSSQTFPMLKNIENVPGSMDAKKSLWVPRGDSENPARCFMESKSDALPNGYFNIGTSKVQVTQANYTFTSNECGAFRGSMEFNDFVKVIYASTCYYDLVNEAIPNSFSSNIIYTTKDEEMKDALMAAGWTKPEAGNSFFDSLTSIAPEVEDGRGPRFSVENGEFMERCIVNDDSESGWHYGYEATNLLVHETGCLLAGLESYSDGDLGAAE